MRIENGTCIYGGKEDYAEGKMVRLLQITNFIRGKEGGEGFLKKTKLVSIVAGRSERNLIYAGKKQEAAASLGLNLEIVDLGEDANPEEIEDKINESKDNSDVAGIMIQLPLGEKSKGETKNLIQLIPIEEDLDGMDEDPQVVAPVAQAAWEVYGFGIKNINPEVAQGEIVVVGAKGFVGRKIVQIFNSKGVQVTEVDLDTPDRFEIIKRADVVISACSQPDSIGRDMIKKGAWGIDISYGKKNGKIKGDFKDDVVGWFSFAALVPGGIGPMTIAALMEKFVRRLVTLAGARGILTEREVDKLTMSLV